MQILGRKGVISQIGRKLSQGAALGSKVSRVGLQVVNPLLAASKVIQPLAPLAMAVPGVGPALAAGIAAAPAALGTAKRGLEFAGHVSRRADQYGGALQGGNLAAVGKQVAIDRQAYDQYKRHGIVPGVSGQMQRPGMMPGRAPPGQYTTMPVPRRPIL